MSESLPKIETGARTDTAVLLARRRRLELDRLALRRQEEENGLLPTEEVAPPERVSGIGPIAWWRQLERDRLALLVQAQSAGLFPGPGAEGSSAGASTASGMGMQATKVVDDVQKAVQIVRDRISLYASLSGILSIPPVLLALHLHKLAFDTKLKNTADSLKNMIGQAGGGGESQGGGGGGGKGGGAAGAAAGVAGAAKEAAGGPQKMAADTGKEAAMEAAKGAGEGGGAMLERLKQLAASKVGKLVERVKQILLAEWMLLFLVDGILGLLIFLFVFQIVFIAYIVTHPADFYGAVLRSAVDYIGSFF